MPIRASLQRLFRALACAGCVLAFGTAAARAQAIGQLAGVVRDDTGGVLPGASVTISGAALIAPRTVVTDGHGKYEIEQLSRGRYSVTAALRGFEPWSIDVDVDGRSALDVVLLVPSFSERVTVSATKTGATDIQSTPLSITALPARTLEQLGAQTVEGLAGFVPTLTVSQHTGLALVTIRGIGTNSAILGADPSSTTHLDGVYLARPAMGFMDFLNVERVEVLRGPQGTLYGRNSVGGTINIVTRQPTNALETSVRLTAGSYDKLRAEGAVSGPLIKNKVMGNFAFVRGTREGFVKDLDHPEHSLGSEDTWAGRGQLRLVFGARSELLLSGDHRRYEGVPLPYAKPIAAKPGYTFVSPASLWEVRASQLASGKNIQQGASAKLTVQLNSTTTLNSLTAYRRSNYHVFFDGDATELTLQTTDVPDVQHQTSEELTLMRRTPRLTWIGGAFFFEEHTEGRVEITVYPAVQIRPFAKIGTNAWALFGQATYSLSSRVSVTGGHPIHGRAEGYRQHRRDVPARDEHPRQSELVLSVRRQQSPSMPGRPRSASRHRHRTTRSFTFPLREASRAADSTRLHRGLVWPSAPSSHGAMKVVSSARWPEGVSGRTPRCSTPTIATCRCSRSSAPVCPTSATPRPRSSRVSKSKWRRRRGVARELSGHFSWLDATYDRFLAVLPGGATRLVAGNRLNNAPEWSGSGSAVYEFATGRAGTASVRGDLSWQSQVFFTPVNDAIETQRAYGLVHLRAGFEPPGRRWEIAVYVRNAGNREYIIGTGNAAPAAVTARPGEPRLWGTQFTLRR